jgi:hypothetical protein
MTRPKVCKASVAFACDGSILANVHGFAGETDPQELLRRATELGGAIFVGVKLRGGEVRDTLARVEDAGHEGAGAAFVERGRRRGKARKDASKKHR